MILKLKKISLILFILIFCTDPLESNQIFRDKNVLNKKPQTSRFLSEIKSINLEETSYIDNQSDTDKPKLLSSDNIALSPGKKRMMEFLNKHKK